MCARGVHRDLHPPQPTVNIARQLDSPRLLIKLFMLTPPSHPPAGFDISITDRSDPDPRNA
ncbi:hypothetical protein Dda_2587 [Drechslerella dactyloides]|uniref:Uncharacterized protein n=1 Tax=Drechslerella dactyloides TaxID=74499 RepID=A0AAD6NM39_DREDA|nr:hypothetical protein Dda_2587 [Drechslerella dactyloides]